MSTPLLRLDAKPHVLRVWLGGPDEQGALEADVREVAGREIARLSTLAVALGAVAERHKLGVRVVPRIDDDGESVLVIFGRRKARPSQPNPRARTLGHESTVAVPAATHPRAPRPTSVTPDGTASPAGRPRCRGAWRAR